MPLKYFMLLLLVGSLVIACSDDSDNPTAPGHQLSAENAIMPLAAGNYWIFKTTRSVNDEITTWYDTTVVTGPVEINDTQWFNVANSTRMSAQPFRNTPDGTALWAKDAEALMFKYPAVAGDSLLALTGGGLVTVHVVSIDEATTTSAGIFYCYKYYWEDPVSNETQTWFFAPRIGFVMSAYFNEINDNPQFPDGHLETSVSELIEYHLEK